MRTNYISLTQAIDIFEQQKIERLSNSIKEEETTIKTGENAGLTTDLLCHIQSGKLKLYGNLKDDIRGVLHIVPESITSMIIVHHGSHHTGYVICNNYNYEESYNPSTNYDVLRVLGETEDVYVNLSVRYAELVELVKSIIKVDEKEQGYDVHMTKDKEAWFKAAASGNLEEAKRLLDKGISIDALNMYGYTAPYIAAANFHTEIVNFLSEKISNNCSLLEATESGDFEKVKLLLDKGADVNTVDVWGGTSALSMAAFNGHIEIIKFLLEKGADVNAKNDVGYTPLMGAAGNGYTNIVRLLLRSGAKANIRNDMGENAIDLAENEEIIKLLEPHINALMWE